MSDNRVTVQATANLLANNQLDLLADEQTVATIVVPDTVYDINLFNLGDTVGFSGFANFIDFTIVQITRINRNPNSVALTLGVLQQRNSATVEQLRRELDKLQTIDNPTTPS